MSIFTCACTQSGYHHPPLSIWVFSLSYGPSAITHLLGFHPTTLLSANFINFSSIFRFSCTHAPDLVITTHPGLPSPSTFDWPNIPPTCWPQCHSLLLSPLFLSIFIDITSNLPICPPSPSGLQPTLPGLHALLNPSVCPSAYLGLVPSLSVVTTG